MSSSILLAEGNEVLSAAYESFLIAEGFRVATVRTGVECLETLRRDPPRLLVLDPAILWGGMGILALISDRDDLPPVPVLILTERPEDILAGLIPPGPSAIVLKPFAPVALAAMIRSLEPVADVVLTLRQSGS
jgi:two-component system response regulator BaeR